MWNALLFFIFCTCVMVFGLERARFGAWELLPRASLRSRAWWFFSPPSIANVYHADYSGVRVLWPQIYHWDSLAGCSSRHLRVERGTTATFQADWHMTRVLDIVGTVTYGDKWNIKVGSEREKFTYRPVTRLKQRNNGNKLNICLSLLLFMIILTLLCV